MIMIMTHISNFPNEMYNQTIEIGRAAIKKGYKLREAFWSLQNQKNLVLLFEQLSIPETIIHT